MIGYIRVSDSQRADGESQREAIKAYAAKRGIQITDWIEEHVSATKTELSAYFGLSGHLFRFHPARRFGVIRPA